MARKRKGSTKQKTKPRDRWSKVRGRDPDMLYISRVNAPQCKSFGWYVRVPCRHGQKYAKFFSDAKHGGKKTALKAAKAWRNEQYKIEWGEPPSSFLVTRNRKVLADPELPPGVTRSVSTTPRGKEHVYWIARWYNPETGKEDRALYPVSKYGEEMAMQMAIARRTQEVGRLRNSFMLPSAKASEEASRTGRRKKPRSRKSSSKRKSKK